MDPDARFAATLAVSLLCWTPVLLSCLEGSIGLERGLLWYVAALGFAVVAVRGLEWLLSGFARGNEVRRLEALRAEADAEPAADDVTRP